MSLSLREQLENLPLPRLTTVLRVSTCLDDSVDVFNAAKDVIDKWWQQKSKPYGTLPALGDDITFARPNFRVERVQANDCFALLVEENDSAYENRKWICDFALQRQANRFELSVRLSFEQPSNALYPKPLPRSPKFLREIVDLKGLRDVWPIKSDPHLITQNDVDFFCDLVTDKSRQLPVIAVSVDSKTGDSLVDADKLARLLSGTAHLFVLEPSASWKLTLDWGNDWSTYQQAVRCYNPGFSRIDDKFSHRLWLPNTIQRLDAAMRDGFLNACTSHVFTQTTALFEERLFLTPLALRRDLAEHRPLSITIPTQLKEDLSVQALQELEDINKQELPDAEDPTYLALLAKNQELQLALDLLRQQLLEKETSLQQERSGRASANKELDETKDLLELYKEDNETLTQKHRIATGDSSAETSPTLRPLWEGFSQLLDAAQNVAIHFRRLEAETNDLSIFSSELGSAREEIQRLKATIDSLSRREENDAPQLDRQKLLELLSSAVSKNPTLTSSLALIEELYKDRVVVLDSAYTSAKQSYDFKYGIDAFQMLTKLAGVYWRDVQICGDTEARKHFGAAYAARDKTTLSKEGRIRRTFEYKSQPLFMEKHLKVGVAYNSSDTLRIHFEWLPDEKRIVIGHCGGHLDF